VALETQAIGVVRRPICERLDGKPELALGGAQLGLRCRGRMHHRNGISATQEDGATGTSWAPVSRSDDRVSASSTRGGIATPHNDACARIRDLRRFHNP
jgi:hypothetical protein